MLERLYISSDLGSPWDSPAELETIAGERDVRATLHDLTLDTLKKIAGCTVFTGSGQDYNIIERDPTVFCENLFMSAQYHKHQNNHQHPPSSFQRFTLASKCALIRVFSKSINSSSEQVVTWVVRLRSQCA